MNMIQQIAKILDSLFNGFLTPDVLFFICAGIIVLSFIVMLIASFLDYQSKMSTAVSKIVKGKKQDANFNINSVADKMPARLSRMFSIMADNSQLDAKDVIGYDAVVSVPYAKSAARRMLKIVLIASAFALALLSFGLKFTNQDSRTLYGALAALLIVGLVFAVLAGVIASVKKSKAIANYENLIGTLTGELNFSALETTPKAEKTVREKPVKAIKEKPVKHVKERVIEEQDDNIVTEAPFVQENIEPAFEPEFAPQQNFNNNNFFEKSHITVEMADEPQDNFVAEPVVLEPVIDNSAEIAAEAARAEAARVNAAKLEAEENARIAAEIEAVNKAEQEAQLMAEAKAKSQAATEDVIARINKINAEGAPLATMKEVALLLQQERAKPENKTPEQQRKLNEALASLLKSMSAATKR